MNLSTAVLLINEGCRAVLGTYEADTPTVPANRIMFKTFDASIAKDDLVIVPTSTRHCMTVVKIVEVDVDVDFESETKVEWIIDKVDVTKHKLLLDQESAMLQKIQSAQAKKKRDELRATLLADSLDAIKSLPIATLASE